MGRQHYDPPKLFLCHSSEDKEFVDWLAGQLRAVGVRVWLDKWEIRVGDSIVQKINDGISTSDHLVVVLSQKAVRSRWVNEELSGGLLRNIESKGAFVLPVLVEDCEIPPLLSHRCYADFRTDRARGLSDLAEALRPRSADLNASLEQLAMGFDVAVAEIRSRSSRGEVSEELVPFVVQLTRILDEAVHLRFSYEIDPKAPSGRSARWNVFYEELKFLEEKGIRLRNNPAWGRLRNIRDYYVHPPSDWWQRIRADLELLLGELDDLRAVLAGLMIDDGQQGAPADADKPRR